MENVVIVNPQDLAEKRKAFVSNGINKIHVVADFDRTLTKAFVDGEKTPSLISELRTRGYISEDYSAKANALSDKYHPTEIDPNIPFEEKRKVMHEWWSKHFQLLIESGLNKSHLEKIIESGRIQFREGAGEFLDFLDEKGIPLVILSSAGLGGDSIEMFLEKQGKLYGNITIVSNSFVWGEDGKAIGIREPIIHVFNKDEASLRHYRNFHRVRDRKNVLLLGDSLGDVEMIKGFDYDNLIKIGFLNDEIDKNLDFYKKAFDILVLNDGKMDYVNNLLKKI
ncbi:MAG: hypothetical protein AABW63_00910 [Nanoarchaeota archaeon]